MERTKKFESGSLSFAVPQNLYQAFIFIVYLHNKGSTAGSVCASQEEAHCFDSPVGGSDISNLGDSGEDSELAGGIICLILPVNMSESLKNS